MFEFIEETFPVVKRTGGGWLAKCPAHEDNKASLSIKIADDRVLLKCHAGTGCSVDAIIKAAGLKMRDLYLNGTTRKQAAQTRIVASYDYRDERGALLFQVLRMDPKRFQQRRPIGGGKWAWNLDGVRRVPYRLPEIIKRPGMSVIVVEGEKDADRLWSLGIVATCNNGGAGKWDIDFGRWFTGRRVAIIPDNDDPGRQHAATVAGSLAFHGAAGIAIVPLGIEGKGADVSDFLGAGKTKDELIAALRSADWFQRKGKQ